MEVVEKRNNTISFSPTCCRNWNSRKSPIEDGLDSSNSKAMEERPGWKAIPYILGNETIERIATYGMQANFMMYLVRVFNLSQVGAANVLNIWLAVSNCTPVLGAAVADAYLGKFRTIAVASIGTIVGIVILTLTAWLPQLHPPSCISHPHVCVPPTSTQLAILILGLSWLAIGTGGIRPCAIPFAIEQFDTNNPEGRRGVSRFYNWYYTTQTVVQLINMTVIVYLQNKSWIVGFGTLGVLMVFALITFLAGKNVYLYIPAEGSVFSGIAQVFVAAYKKHRLQVPAKEEEGVYYDPPLKDDKALKIPLTEQLMCLNKAAMIQDSELNAEGKVTNAWRLCSIQQVEEVKCLVKLFPIWASSILILIPISQQGSFLVTQAMKMDRHLGHLEIPAATFNIVSLITIGIWLPCYDLFVQPALAKATKQEEGITSLQKIVIGNIFSVLMMVSAGILEWQRRGVALLHGAPRDGVAPMSAMWQAPSYVMLGFAEVFTTIGQIQFYNSESPDKMKSVGNSLLYLVTACSTYVGVLVVNVVHKVTQKHGTTDWLSNDINAGRYDYYFFLIAGLGALNLLLLLYRVKRYRYKDAVKAEVLHTP